MAAPARAGLSFGLALCASELAFGSVDCAAWGGLPFASLRVASHRTCCADFEPSDRVRLPPLGKLEGICWFDVFGALVNGGEGGMAAPAVAGLSFGLALCASELAFGSVRTL